MNRTYLQIVLYMFVVIGILACGRKEAGPTAPVPATQDTPKVDDKKANPPDEPPKVADPLKEGY